jgi:heme-degrading monooxygenase HmoA
MYMVVSRWEINPGHEEELKQRAPAVRDALRSEPGVTLVESFKSEDGSVIAVVGYESREAYDRIVNSPSGAFQKALEQHRLEDHGRWVSSDRGETIDDRAPAGIP